MKKFTVAELYLIKICCEKGEATAREIWEQSLKDRERSYMTIKTLLDRMVEKGFLTRRKIGPVGLYTPTITGPQVISGAIDDFVKNVLDDTVSPLFTYYIKTKKMNRDEMSELKKMIDEAEED